MFGRKKSPADQEVIEPEPQEPAGKGHPTPKRREVEAARRRPLISADPKADKKAAREAQRVERQRVNDALITGDEAHMPAAHRGPVRRYIRDYVDARFSLGELFFPLTIVIIVAMLLANVFQRPEMTVVIVVGLYVVVLVALVDAVVMSIRLKRRLVKKFGAVRGTHMYTISRAMQMRRMRLPKPQVERGQYPS